MADDVREDALEQLREAHPELVEDLEKATYHTHSRQLRSQEAEDLVAADYTWLWDFKYQGKKLEKDEIAAVLFLARNGFALSSTAETAEDYNKMLKRIARPHVQAALHKATEEATNRWQISANKVGRELASVLNSNITDFLDTNGVENRITLKDLGRLPREMTAAIQEIQEVRTAQGVTIRLKLYDKLVALNTAAKIMNLFPKETIKVEVSGLENKLAAALQRLQKEPIEGQVVVTEEFEDDR